MVALLGIVSATMAQSNTNPHFDKGYNADVTLLATTNNIFPSTPLTATTWAVDFTSVVAQALVPSGVLRDLVEVLTMFHRSL